LLRQNSGFDSDVSDKQLLPYLATKRELFFLKVFKRLSG